MNWPSEARGRAPAVYARGGPHPIVFLARASIPSPGRTQSTSTGGGPVGDVAEKVVGAEQQGATIFLVPTSEAADARKGASRARVVPVDTFDQARTVLRQGT